MGCVQVGKVSGGGTAATLSSARWRWKPSTHHRDDQVQKKPNKNTMEHMVETDREREREREREPSQPKNPPKTPMSSVPVQRWGMITATNNSPGQFRNVGIGIPMCGCFLKRKRRRQKEGKRKKTERERERTYIFANQHAAIGTVGGEERGETGAWARFIPTPLLVSISP